MNQLNFIMLCGLPGSGKSTYAEKLAASGYTVISSDAIRYELFGDENDQSNNGLVFATMRRCMLECFDHGQNVVFDATNINRKDRKETLKVIPSYVRKICHIIWAPFDLCVEQDNHRARTVGPDVIMRIAKKFQMPYYDEGFDVITIVRPEDFHSVKYFLDIDEQTAIPHNNPHHTLSIKDHCVMAGELAREMKVSDTIELAARIHDFGKPFVKAFCNYKGEPTTDAHYYNHENVGAWIACGITRNLDACWLVGAHMVSFNNEKYYRSLPPYMRKQIDQLNEIDKKAH